MGNIFVEHLPQKGDIPPQSVAAAASATSGWISAAEAPDYFTQINLGALGGGTVTPTFEQANTDSGGAAKALTAWDGGAAMAVDNGSRTLQFLADALDHKNGFLWFRLKLAVTGGTGALVAATIHAVGPRFR